MNNPETEFSNKIEKVRQLMGRKGWVWVALSGTASLAWITGGSRCFVDPGAAAGVATLLVSDDRTIFATDRVEIGRLQDEELAGLPLEYSVHSWTDWYHRRDGVLNRIRGNCLGASDIPLAGWELGESELLPLRFSLTQLERSRLQALGQDAATALEQVAHQVECGMTEKQIATNIQATLAAQDIRSPVTLVATDERVFKYRHPLPTSKKMDKYGMLVTSATRHGLYVSLTRLVHLGEPLSELQAKSKACAEIDAMTISLTKVGTPVNQIFDSLVDSYKRHGHTDEWKLHHQGGAGGYRAREYFADLDSPFTVHSGQSFAWNPSITGVKSEDTILTGMSANNIVTATGNWPQISTIAGIDRPAILEL